MSSMLQILFKKPGVILKSISSLGYMECSSIQNLICTTTREMGAFEHMLTIESEISLQDGMFLKRIICVLTIDQQYTLS